MAAPTACRPVTPPTTLTATTMSTSSRRSNGRLAKRRIATKNSATLIAPARLPASATGTPGRARGSASSRKASAWLVTASIQVRMPLWRSASLREIHSITAVAARKQVWAR